MTSVYRVPEAEPPVAGKPTELAYHPLRRGHGSSAVGFFTLIFPIFAGAVLAMVGLPELALPAMAVVGVAIRVSSRREKKRPAATLRLDGRTLRVFGPTGKQIVATSLTEIVDFTLEIKTIEMVQEAPGPVPELMYVNATVGPALDTSRIHVVTLRDGPIPLTEELMPHSDSLEWRGKMRQFLRKHDWKPEETAFAPPRVKTKKKRPAVTSEPGPA